jgi:hypothetical protein
LKDKNHQEKKLSEVASFELEIVRFDTVLDYIQNYFPQDTRIWDFVAYARGSIFRLQQALHGLDIIDFTSVFERPSCGVEEDSSSATTDEGNRGMEAA